MWGFGGRASDPGFEVWGSRAAQHQPPGQGSQFENNYFTKMCSGSEAGSYSRLIGFVYHSTLGLCEIKKKRKVEVLRFRASRLGVGRRVQELRVEGWGLRFGV